MHSFIPVQKMQFTYRTFLLLIFQITYPFENLIEAHTHTRARARASSTAHTQKNAHAFT